MNVKEQIAYYEWVRSLEIGAEVFVKYTFGSFGNERNYITTIERRTPAFLILKDESRVRRSDGKLIGHGRRGCISPATDEVKLMLQKAAHERSLELWWRRLSNQQRPPFWLLEKVKSLFDAYEAEKAAQP
jgi:hypothetical protein